MIYTKKQFGEDLKNKLPQTKNMKEISEWSFELLNDNFGSLEDELDDILMTLTIMHNNREFKLTMKELLEVADDLAEEREVKIKINKDLLKHLKVMQNGIYHGAVVRNDPN